MRMDGLMREAHAGLVVGPGVRRSLPRSRANAAAAPLLVAIDEGMDAKERWNPSA